MNWKAIHPGESSFLTITEPFWSILIPTETHHLKNDWAMHSHAKSKLTRLIHNDRWERHKKLQHGFTVCLDFSPEQSFPLQRWQCWSPGCENHLLTWKAQDAFRAIRSGGEGRSRCSPMPITLSHLAIQPGNRALWATGVRWLLHPGTFQKPHALF